MNSMAPDDWTTDDTLTEEQIRQHLADEAWEPVAVTTGPHDWSWHITSAAPQPMHPETRRVRLPA